MWVQLQADNLFSLKSWLLTISFSKFSSDSLALLPCRMIDPKKIAVHMRLKKEWKVFDGSKKYLQILWQKKYLNTFQILCLWIVFKILFQIQYLYFKYVFVFQNTNTGLVWVLFGTREKAVLVNKRWNISRLLYFSNVR